MNHFAFDVAPERIAEYRDKLIAKGLEVSTFMHHDDSPSGLSETVTEKVWISSIYFRDPNGIVLEFAATQRASNPAFGDRCRPHSSDAGRPRPIPSDRRRNAPTNDGVARVNLRLCGTEKTRSHSSGFDRRPVDAGGRESLRMDQRTDSGRGR